MGLVSGAFDGARIGFAQGFLPFHSDDALPRGLQEDDDFTFKWGGPTSNFERPNRGRLETSPAERSGRR
jgi:hypothetical protein